MFSQIIVQYAQHPKPISRKEPDMHMPRLHSTEDAYRCVYPATSLRFTHSASQFFDSRHGVEATSL